MCAVRHVAFPAAAFSAAAVAALAENKPRAFSSMSKLQSSQVTVLRLQALALELAIFYRQAEISCRTLFRTVTLAIRRCKHKASRTISCELHVAIKRLYVLRLRCPHLRQE